MIQNIPRRFIRKFITRVLVPKAKCSYSQFGEDLIIEHLFAILGIEKPTYLDIGANEPFYISNTYYFYEHGGKGVLVEPNPYLYKKLKAARPRDIVLNTGIGLEKAVDADFYVFPDYANGLSTFSKKDARHWEEVGMKGMGKIPVECVIKMSLIPINNILEKYFIDKAPNIISVDVEGMDLDILKSMDFNRYRPEIICVETLGYDDNQNGFKIPGIDAFMLTKDYTVYADTRVNTIFCRKDILNK